MTGRQTAGHAVCRPGRMYTSPFTSQLTGEKSDTDQSCCPDLPGPDSRPAELLGGTRLRNPAAYDMEVGAGTFHTATFLRSIGPEIWNAAYAQPSRRPADGRYGENPNRLQHYYQFQVVLKPNPDNIQELYLDSLRHIGIDP